MTYRGLDLLGAGNSEKYRKRILKYFPYNWASGFLMRCNGANFGDPSETIDDLLGTGNCPTVRIHLLWDDNHSFSEADIPKIVRQAKKVNDLMTDNPNVKFFVSPCLEHRLDFETFEAIKAAVKNVLPGGTKVISSGHHTKGIIELHHSQMSYPKEMFSYDGLDMLDASDRTHRNYANVHDHAKIAFGWCNRFNCRKDANDNTPRNERTKFPKRKHFNQCIELMKKYW